MSPPWMALLEAHLVRKLLQSPAFHGAIGRAYKAVQRARYGLPPEERGGTKLDQPGFGQHFLDELKTQLGRPAAKDPAAPRVDARKPKAQMTGNEVQDPNQPDFVSHFMDELRSQFKSKR